MRDYYSCLTVQDCVRIITARFLHFAVRVYLQHSTVTGCEQVWRGHLDWDMVRAYTVAEQQVQTSIPNFSCVNKSL